MFTWSLAPLLLSLCDYSLHKRLCMLHGNSLHQEHTKHREMMKRFRLSSSQARKHNTPKQKKYMEQNLNSKVWTLGNPVRTQGVWESARALPSWTFDNFKAATTRKRKSEAESPESTTDSNGGLKSLKPVSWS